jgi:hypothetical protein
MEGQGRPTARILKQNEMLKTFAICQYDVLRTERINLWNAIKDTQKTTQQRVELRTNRIKQELNNLGAKS